MSLPVFIAILCLVLIPCLMAVGYMIVTAPLWDQEEEHGTFYVKPLGGDHE